MDNLFLLPLGCRVGESEEREGKRGLCGSSRAYEGEREGDSPVCKREVWGVWIGGC